MELHIAFEIGRQPRQIVKHDARIAEMRATVEAIIKANERFCILVFSLKLSLAFSRSQQLHVFGKVTELARRGTTTWLRLQGRQVR